MAGRGRPVLVLAIVVVLTACGGLATSPIAGTGRPMVPATTAATAATPTVIPDPSDAPPMRTAVPATTLASPSAGGVAEPPAASLAAEGGDPVLGQLGSYVWADGGSDSPWLQGTPIAVGAAEPLDMVVDPAVRIATWAARMVPAGASSPAGAVSLGQGTGTPRFEAPGPGAWTVTVQVRFADDLGSAAYFWALTST
jgi:hypothetical protein